MHRTTPIGLTAGLYLALSAACGGGESPRPDDTVARALDREPVVLRMDSLMARVTALDSDRFLERARGLLVREDEVLVADAGAGKVFRFGHDGSPIGAMGAPGRGPGELVRPTVLRDAGGGEVAVLDGGATRIALYGPEGEPAGSAPLRNSTTSFAPGADGRFLVPSAHSDAFLEVSSASSEPRLVAGGDSLPPALAEVSPVERAGHMRLLLAPGGDGRSVFVLRNFDGLALWSLALDPALEEVVSGRRVRLPGWLVDAYDRYLAEYEARFEERELSVALVNDFSRVRDGRVWITAGPIRAVGVELPVAGEGRPRVVFSAEGERGRQQREGLEHAVVRGDRLFALYGYELRVYRLERTDEPIEDVL